MALGKPQDARSDFREAISHEASDYAQITARAACLAYLGDFDQALTECLKSPDEVRWTHFTLARIHCLKSQSPGIDATAELNLACDAIESAFARGLRKDFPFLKNDTDLAALQTFPRFQKLIDVPAAESKP